MNGVSLDRVKFQRSRSLSTLSKRKEFLGCTGKLLNLVQGIKISRYVSTRSFFLSGIQRIDRESELNRFGQVNLLGEL